MTRSRSLAVLLAIPLMTLAACGGGGGSSDEDEIRKIVNDTVRDPALACGHLEASALTQLGGASKCKATLTTAGRGRDTDVSIDSVKIDGDKASVNTSSTKAGRETIRFTKRDGKWLLTAK